MYASLWVFDHAPKRKQVGDFLLSTKQGKHRVSEYTLEIHTPGAESGWNEPTQKSLD